MIKPKSSILLVIIAFLLKSPSSFASSSERQRPPEHYSVLSPHCDPYNNWGFNRTKCQDWINQVNSRPIPTHAKEFFDFVKGMLDLLLSFQNTVYASRGYHPSWEEPLKITKPMYAQFAISFFKRLPAAQARAIDFDLILVPFVEKHKLWHYQEIALAILKSPLRTRSSSIFHLLFGKHPFVEGELIDAIFREKFDLFQEFATAKDKKGRKVWEYIAEDLYRPSIYLSEMITSLHKYEDKDPLVGEVIDEIQAIHDRSAAEEALARSRAEEVVRARRQACIAGNVSASASVAQPAAQYQAQEKIEITKELKDFIEGRKRAAVPNGILSTKFNLDSDDFYLSCSISKDFPEIPVIFLGTLYDYNELIKEAKDGRITDPISRKIDSIDNIQPDRRSQAQMDDLIQKETAKAAQKS